MEQLTEEMFNNVNHWTGDTRGCLRGKQCMYLHNSGKKGVKVKMNKSNYEMESESEGRSVDKEITRQQRDDSLNEVITEKDKVIKEKDEEIAKLRAENESLVEGKFKDEFQVQKQFMKSK